MKTVCPACGATSSLEALLTDGEARLFMAALTRLPSQLVFLTPKYLALFRPQTGRVLQWRKGTRLLDDLNALVQMGYVHRKGMVDRPCTITAWAKALERIVASAPNRLPLKNHQYLVAIAWDIADGMDRKVEQHQHQRVKAEIRPKGQLTAPMSLEQMQTIRKKNMHKSHKGK